MRLPPPNVFKPLSEEQIRELLEKHKGKEQGVQLEDVFTPEQIERIRQQLKQARE